MSEARRVRIHEVLRYDASFSTVEAMLGEYLNFWHLQQTPGIQHPRMLLSSGINPIGAIRAVDQDRVPAVALRTSAWRAGSNTTPWHDEYDLNHGHVRYYGDHKVSTLGPVGVTRGNGALMDQWRLHGSGDPADRSMAAPMFIFRAIPMHVDGVLRNKGHVEFCGAAIIERLEYVLQRDPQTGSTFPNIALDLNVVRLDENDELDLRWLDDRRNPQLSAAQALRHAPESWKDWVRRGRVSLPSIRRRVMSSRVQSREDQLPAPRTVDATVLEKVYRNFDGNKHAFEWLAALVAEQVMGHDGATYRHGWITKAGGDGGMDFVGRLDVGSTDAKAPLVVLGQAKCIKPSSTINADQVARVVARLRRGWIGVYVTTGTFTEQAQVEIVDDEYPVVLIPGRVLADAVRKLAEQSFQGDVDRLLASALEEYPQAVLQRRPEEIVSAG